MATILNYLRNEHGAEMAEWVVTVALLTMATAALLGPGGMLHSAVAAGLDQIASIIARP
jgi:Flp pilus assembly pilin Flp